MYGIVGERARSRSARERQPSPGSDPAMSSASRTALIDHLPRSLAAIAAEPSTIAEIDRALFLFLIDTTPMFARSRSWERWPAELPRL